MTIVKRKELAHAIRSEVETLETVDTCFLFNGTFDIVDFNRVKSNAEYGTTCFIHLVGGDETNPQRHISQSICNVNIYVYGLQELDEEEKILGVSELCYDTLDELDGLVWNNNFGLDLPRETRPSTWEAIPIPFDDEDQNLRVMGYLYTFQVTLNTAKIEPFQI